MTSATVCRWIKKFFRPYFTIIIKETGESRVLALIALGFACFFTEWKNNWGGSCKWSPVPIFLVEAAQLHSAVLDTECSVFKAVDCVLANIFQNPVHVTALSSSLSDYDPPHPPTVFSIVYRTEVREVRPMKTLVRHACFPPDTVE